MRWGKYAESLAEQAAEGQDIPAIRNCPVLPEYMEEAWNAFWLLSPSRPVGFSIGAIPLTEIEAYCRMFYVEDMAFLVRSIHALDRVYIEARNAELEAKTKK